MAQNARIAALTDELIQSILHFDPQADRRAYKHAKDIATRGLKAHQYNRTSQFDVQSSFSGLDEKFRVLNRDDLADALGSRVQELQERPNKWIPEYLSLLLQLSDRPVENSDVEALNILRPPTPPPPLTWAEIIEDDPYSDEEIWKDIDYGVESSDDEAKTPKIRGGRDAASSVTSTEEDDTFNPESCVVPIDDTSLAEITSAQFWRAAPDEETGKIDITELQAVRETLFMLAGLHASLYIADKQHSNVRVNHKYVFSHAIAKTMDHLLSQLAEVGHNLSRLRQWTQRPSTLPLVQTFEAAVRTRLATFDRELALLQQQYLAPTGPVSVSLLELQHEVRRLSGPLLHLAEVVQEIEPHLLVNPFAHLEMLYERISLAQMTLEAEVLAMFSTIFFECLQTYLKPIRRWMESGELGANDETFFVFENDSSSEVSALWHDRFVLRRGKGNILRAPSFLEPAGVKIFNTGKSVVFLKELAIYGAGLGPFENEPPLDHIAVCGESDLPMSPFPELFSAAFEKWIKSKYSFASAILRTHLFEKCGLLNILNDFSRVYLGANASVLQDLTTAVFERMDTGQRGWNDRFLLTELARGIYGTVLDKGNAEKIIVRSSRLKNQTRSVNGLASISLDYALPWPIMNIIQRSSIPIYQQVFTFLLQLYRAKYLLQSITLHDIRQSSNTAMRQLSYKLRHRLVWLVDILRSYVTETVIALSTQEMLAAMSKAEDIDEMSTIHLKYLARLQEQSLLAENLKPIHRAIISLLDLAAVFHDSVSEPLRLNPSTKQDGKAHPKTNAKISSKKSTRRKSVIPTVVEDSGSDSASGSEEDNERPPDHAEKSVSVERATPFASLKKVEQEFERLLPFVTAGLRNIGRVGAEPVWEMLAERLEWDRKDGG